MAIFQALNRYKISKYCFHLSIFLNSVLQFVVFASRPPKTSHSHGIGEILYIIRLPWKRFDKFKSFISKHQSNRYSRINKDKAGFEILKNFHPIHSFFLAVDIVAPRKSHFLAKLLKLSFVNYLNRLSSKFRILLLSCFLLFLRIMQKVIFSSR